MRSVLSRQQPGVHAPLAASLVYSASQVADCSGGSLACEVEWAVPPPPASPSVGSRCSQQPGTRMKGCCLQNEELLAYHEECPAAVAAWRAR